MTDMKTLNDLNKWISENFLELYGANCAYLEFPFGEQANGAPPIIKRIIFMSIGITSKNSGEEVLVERIYNELVKIREHWRNVICTEQDQQENIKALIIWRSRLSVEASVDKEFDVEYILLRGRLAFWDERLNVKLKNSVIFRYEGKESLVI